MFFQTIWLVDWSHNGIEISFVVSLIHLEFPYLSLLKTVGWTVTLCEGREWIVKLQPLVYRSIQISDSRFIQWA